MLGIVIYAAFLTFVIEIIYHWGYGDLKPWLKKLLSII